MAICRELMLTFVLGCLFLCTLAPHSTASAEDENSGSSGISSSGGRHILQITNPCPYQFAIIENFTNLEAACPTPNITALPASYPKSACCAALAVMLCPYQSLINDRSSQCAASFWSTLDLGTNHTLNQQFFAFICTNPNSPLGIPCPNSSSPSPSPNASSPKQGLHFFGFTLLVAVAIVEFLFLCF